jgi:hypothetical protein
MRKFDDETDSTAVVGRIRLPRTECEEPVDSAGRFLNVSYYYLGCIKLERLVDYHLYPKRRVPL